SASNFRFDFLISGQTPPDNLYLQVISLTGIIVQSIEANEFFIGTNHITWNGDDFAGNGVPSGLYIYQITFYKDGQEVPITLPESESFLKGGYGKFVLSR
ncbi:MAG: hypothetical protein OEU76_08600, partial [Cyclobacteriaceae bacterium]|nr:hypothetical protein [Cyclobacteriaceae bacterium]